MKFALGSKRIAADYEHKNSFEVVWVVGQRPVYGQPFDAESLKPTNRQERSTRVIEL
jgi:hypothetical protein